MEQLTFWSGELPVKTSPSPEREPDFLESAADWPSTLSTWLVKLHRAGFFGKTFPDACPRTAGSTSVPLPKRWLTAGIILPTESWTLNISESPRDAVECSLSGILETGDLAQRYFSAVANAMTYFCKKKCKEVYCRVSRASGEEQALREYLMLCSQQDNSES